MLILGIDTGGTYTDGVVIDRKTKQIYCESKALTTPRDLSSCIAECIHQLHFSAWSQIGMVCLSTTLATNAVVEGKGCRTGLILLGKMPNGKLPAEEQIVLSSSVGIRGGIQERIHRDEVIKAIQQLRATCAAIAVSGYASVRNPVQEQQVKKIANELFDIPVVCGHEMTGTLGFYERTVTAVLNARLIAIIKKLLDSVAAVMVDIGISAPIMVMRGDGSLMRASYARMRPIETILSGPAASVIGGIFLSGRKDCQIIDIGGTTTDIAAVRNGQCNVSKEGAVIAGWHTRVRAMEICTYGFGGDSRIQINGSDSVKIGPQKGTPFCRAELDEDNLTLTPTDILHASGEFVQWNAKKSQMQIQAIARKYGRTDWEQIRWLKERVTDQLYSYCEESSEVFDTKDMTIVGVGAPAQAWLLMAKHKMKRDIVIPKYAFIANAVGAAVGKIHETTEVLIRKDRLHKKYILFTERERIELESLTEGQTQAKMLAEEIVRWKAVTAGAAKLEISSKCCVVRDKQGNWIEETVFAVATGDPQP